MCIDSLTQLSPLLKGGAVRMYTGFIYRALAARVWDVALSAALVAMGIDGKWLVGLLMEPPTWTWWAWTTPAKLAFFLAAIGVIGRAFWEQSRLEIQIPDHLMRKDRVSFLEVASTLSEIPSLKLDRETALQKLMRALWRGDFESRSGRSRLRLPYSGMAKLVGDKWLSVVAGEDGDDDDVDFSPPLYPCGRRELLSGWDLGLQEVYPSLQPLLPALHDMTQAWTGIASRINFSRLQRIPIENYDEIFRLAYLEPLVMTRRDLVWWFGRLRDGHYDVR